MTHPGDELPSTDPGMPSQSAADNEPGTGLIPELLDAHEASSQAATRARPLLAVIVFQVLAQVVPIAGFVLATTLGPAAAGSLVPALINSNWPRVALAVALLLLLALSAARLVRRARAGSPVGWISLGAAIAAQVLLALDSVAAVARTGVNAASGPLGASREPGWLSPAVGVLVFLLTFSAYLVFRNRPATDATRDGSSSAAGNRPSLQLRSAALGIAAILVILTGNMAAASIPPSPAIACADVTASVGIAFRGDLGDVVIDGNDMAVLLQGNTGNGVAAGDYDRDGNVDLYLLGQAGHESRLYHNDHSATHEGFTDVTQAAGLGGFTGSRAAQFVDLNNDGLLDLVAANDAKEGVKLQPSRIYQNLGDGTFKDVTPGSGFLPIGSMVGGLGIADYNRDGLPDIYVTYWVGRQWESENSGSRNLLFKNLGGFRFEDVTDQTGVGLSTGSFQPIFADLNGDAWPDLYVATDGAPETLFLNDHGTFRDATAESGLAVAVRSGMGVALADFEGTGIPSLYITSISDPEKKFGGAPNGLLRPRLRPGGGITYVDDAPAAGVRDAGWGWGTVITDLNLDGNADLFVAQGMDAVTRFVSLTLLNDRAHVYEGTGAGTFIPSTNNGCDITGDQRAAIAFDYNRDGRPDLFVTQVNQDFKLLENRSDPRGHWLTVVAEPTVGHTIVGARVTVIAGGHRWVKQLIGGDSYLSGSPNEAYFGLG
ncbi:MAG: CRTAC1 family protein, partial [Actinomycetes bacterium]